MEGALAQKRRLRQTAHAHAFTQDFLRGLSNALNDSESRSEMCREIDTLRACAQENPAIQLVDVDGRDHDAMSSGTALRKARAVVGKDNSAYLSIGLMVLWRGDQYEDTDAEHPMFPSSIAGCALTGMGAAEEHVLERLAEQAQAQYDAARDTIRMVAPERLAYALSICEVATYVALLLAQERQQDQTSPLGLAADALGAPGFATLRHAIDPQSRFNATDSRQGREALEQDLRRIASSANGHQIVETLASVVGSLCGSEARSLVAGLHHDARARAMRTAEASRSACEFYRTLQRPIPAPTGVFVPASLGVVDASRCLGPEPAPAFDDDAQATAEGRRLEAGALFRGGPIDGDAAAWRLAFGTAPDRRATESVLIALHTGATCERPPHHLVEVRVDERVEMQIPNQFCVPSWTPDLASDDDDTSRSASDGAHARSGTPALTDDLNLSAAYVRKRLLGEIDPPENEFCYHLAQWTPTTVTSNLQRNSWNSSLRWGGVSLDRLSRAVARSTLLGIQIARLQAVGVGGQEALAPYWAAAVLKLEMLPSLHTVNEYVQGGVNVQAAMSHANERDGDGVTTQGLLDDAQLLYATRPRFPNGLAERALFEAFVLNANDLADYQAQRLRAVFPVPILDGNVRPELPNVRPLLAEHFGATSNAGASLIPRFATPQAFANIATRIQGAHGEIARARAAIAAYTDALMALRSGEAASTPTAAPSSSIASVAAPLDVDERCRRSAIWEDSIRELAVSGDRLYTFLKARPRGSLFFPTPPLPPRFVLTSVLAVPFAGYGRGTQRPNVCSSFLPPTAHPPPAHPPPAHRSQVLHEDVTSIIKLEDRTMEANHRMYREQRRDAMRDIASFGQKVVDTVLASVFKDSNLRVDLSSVRDNGDGAPDGSAKAADEVASSLVVVSQAGLERVNELASGTTGLGVLEANVQLQSYLKKSRGSPVTLRRLISDLRGILDSHRNFVLHSIQSNQEDLSRSSMEYLAEPKNSLVIRLRNETFAAIRVAYEELGNELRATGCRRDFIPSAYECVEGTDYELCDQFAQFAAYKLAQARAFSSGSSIYVTDGARASNLRMVRITLGKMMLRVGEHRHKTLRGAY